MSEKDNMKTIAKRRDLLSGNLLVLMFTLVRANGDDQQEEDYVRSGEEDDNLKDDEDEDWDSMFRMTWLLILLFIMGGMVMAVFFVLCKKRCRHKDSRTSRSGANPDDGSRRRAGDASGGDGRRRLADAPPDGVWTTELTDDFEQTIVRPVICLEPPPYCERPPSYDEVKMAALRASGDRASEALDPDELPVTSATPVGGRESDGERRQPSAGYTNYGETRDGDVGGGEAGSANMADDVSRENN